MMTKSSLDFSLVGRCILQMERISARDSSNDMHICTDLYHLEDKLQHNVKYSASICMQLAWR